MPEQGRIFLGKVSFLTYNRIIQNWTNQPKKETKNDTTRKASSQKINAPSTISFFVIFSVT